jgi:hypothetical protein
VILVHVCIPPTTHEDYITKHGNVVPGQPQTDGIYATPNGHPVYKFDVPIVAGHNYTKWVHELTGGAVNNIPLSLTVFVYTLESLHRRSI